MKQMFADDELKSSAKRVIAFWLAVIFAVAVGIVLCALMTAVLGSGPAQPYSYQGGFHDHRL